MKSSSEIRQDFFNFFKSKGHEIVPSAPVIPYDDPTLLFTNAGMNQFKDVFLGTGKRTYERCADTQKCIRVSGKHNDLEEVGHDGYHHTFFEMLGNWSFGDYYKKEAIKWAWELLIDVWKIPKEKLWATVFKTDDESFELWHSETNIDRTHILKFDEKDNFWEMGETGPCGPCSEIHFDFALKGCKPEDINKNNPDIIELWNLVFIQYNRDEKGELHDLSKKHVDTGMGFERVVRILQNKNSNYETDIFLPLINELIQITGKDYNSDKYISSMNVIADHIRALTFAIGDGAIPSNEGRGYVLRRILRRAARYGRNLDMHKPFIYGLADVLVNAMGNVFPEIKEKQKFIKEVVKGEEEGFNETLDRGLVYFNEEIEKMEKIGNKVFSGEVAFKLHDTYGFPIDLTQLMARERGFKVNEYEFSDLMTEQRFRSRGGFAYDLIGTDKNLESTLSGTFLNIPNEFVGYTELETDSIIEDFDIGGTTFMTGSDYNNFFHVVLNKTPLYPESGGQVEDKGQLIWNGKSYEIHGNVKNQHGKIIHRIYNYFDKPIPRGETVKVKVIKEQRNSICRNHSATHLVHEALWRVLGSHVKQMGSYLDDKLLRFDFPHFHKLETKQIQEIESIVNQKIYEKINVYAENMSFTKASKIPNVKRIFGEKYDDEVRVVFIDEKFSVEFCGGTHVKETSDIGLFKIVKEESISSGTKRIFARTGEGIVQFMSERLSDIENVINDLPEKYTNNFKSAIDSFRKDFKSADFRDVEFLKKLMEYQDSTLNSLYELREKYLEEKKQTEKQLARQKVKKAADSLDELIRKGIQLNSIKIVASEFDVDNMDELKEIGDVLRSKIGSGVGLLYSIIDSKINLVTVVSDDLIKEKGLNAGKIANDVAKILGGGGGGRSHLATAGGKDIKKLNEALSKLRQIIQNYLDKNK